MKRRERLQRGGEEEVLAADLKHMDDVIKETQDMGPADDLEDAHSEESVQILKARGELENAEKILLAGNQEDLLREIQGEVRAAVKGRDEVHDEPEEEF
ncbi:hypothetical protein Pmar_PMAR017248 [Perkinsus marinus ATCC 50983]|uniref:Uncharacterized protein n=1 Tax=Perkinsus marinus (strain ATCC 50983 / TXsc) TaxID=423536 RepID=C5KXC0_PERM5|nr:hypothetical protein Pmar_PMAR011671 [Perkinsus marinus ATCC 50983]XP_002779078.1 hypothetical protein Pmar_PMAR017248 [Perkinsus marinus ATCC 50983]EER05643.1 hypothetical protein Pmar_PMAR011671 [Perkinsus marinus ATCC 50983]EER10873.1 hypothetical protein Pmar_PMAR017248 [Perkinsus marinus ATCC 50983]|eukprot:XP_002773827.1 hypothetical protein Pmar_PMAR011671 [Perkinsus marinus ATCC 50983]